MDAPLLATSLNILVIVTFLEKNNGEGEEAPEGVGWHTSFFSGLVSFHPHVFPLEKIVSSRASVSFENGG